MNVRYLCLLLTGVLLVLSAGAHAFAGWPPIRSGLVDKAVAEDLIGGVAVGWWFGSAAMLAFGLIVLHASGRERKGETGYVVPVLVISGAYLLFGVAAFIYRSLDPHFIGFMVLGLLGGVPLIIPRRSRAS